MRNLRSYPENRERDSSKRSAIRTITHCVSCLVFSETRTNPRLKMMLPCALCWPQSSENWVKFSSLNLGICCLPYLVKISGCYHVLRLLNNLPSQLPNPRILTPDPLAHHPAPILSSEFPNQNYLGSSFIFGKLQNIICVRNKNLFWLTNKWPRNPQNSFPVIAWLQDWLITVFSRNFEARGVTQSLITNTTSKEKSISFKSLKPPLKASQSWSGLKYMQACTKYWACLLGTGGCIPLHNNTGPRRCSIGLMASFLLVFDKREVITGHPVSQATVIRHPLCCYK